LLTIVNILSFVILCLTVWFTATNIKDQNFAVGILILFMGFVSIAILKDIGGIQDTLGAVVADIMKNIAQQAQQQK